MSTKRNSSYQDIIKGCRLTSYFQPIVSLDDLKVLGHEALCRLTTEHPFSSIEDFFQYAEKQQDGALLDMLCRESAMRSMHQAGGQALESLLFVNVCPSTFFHPSHSVGKTEALCKRYGIAKDRVVLEVTERESVTNYQLFIDVVSHYRAEGFRVAIDDFGAGYGGLKMLSLLEPDFVKIDKHFFRSKSRSRINYNLIDAVFTACHRIGIDVIAEGIETEEELEVCREIGIEFVQGYFLGRPKPDLATSLTHLSGYAALQSVSEEAVQTIGGLARYTPPLSCTSTVKEAVHFFLSHPDQFSLPVLNQGRLVGLLTRSSFLEKYMSHVLEGAEREYGEDQLVTDLIYENYLEFAHYIALEDVAHRMLERSAVNVYDDVVVSCRGRYLGLVSLSTLLAAITKHSKELLVQPQGITDLPGRGFVTRQLAHLFLCSCHFEVAYIDIDNFKEYNKAYGFDRGNDLLLALADILKEHVSCWGKHGNNCFAAHLAGDDFIFLARPRDAVKAVQGIVEDFHQLHAEFHSKEECQQEFYQVNGRDYPLLSLSVGIVSTSLHAVHSLEQLAPLAADLLGRAKRKMGSAIVRDRREARN